MIGDWRYCGAVVIAQVLKILGAEIDKKKVGDWSYCSTETAVQILKRLGCGNWKIITQSWGDCGARIDRLK